MSTAAPADLAPEPTSDARPSDKTLAGRLHIALEHRQRQSDTPRQYSKSGLAKACGISSPGVGFWFSGDSKAIEAENLLQAARYLGVSPYWLGLGEGGMEEGVRPVAAGVQGTVEALRELRDSLLKLPPARREAIGILLEQMAADPQPHWAQTIAALFGPKENSPGANQGRV